MRVRANPAQLVPGVHCGRPIENQCHWVLDVAFGEDDHRLREGHGPENMSLVRKMALAMLKKAKAPMGVKNKRLKAGWDESFLELVLRDFLED
jgi:predicted transposase YbfD/YdcC